MFDLRKRGFASTLCAARIPYEKTAAFVETVSGSPGVMDNCRRAHACNVRFTPIAPDGAALEAAPARIRETADMEHIPSLRPSALSRSTPASISEWVGRPVCPRRRPCGTSIRALSGRPSTGKGEGK
ncbi:MAG: hypothetical protein AB1558_02395 [Thermodesulfobacteriota bacterium]